MSPPSMSSDLTNMARIFEDIGALKALVASMDAKLDDGNREFKALRDEQVEMKMDLTQIRLGGEARADAVDQIKKSVEKVESRVDQLVALRHRVGGAIFLLSLISGAFYEAWNFLVSLFPYITHNPK